MSTPVRRDGTDWILELRVQPRASRSEFAGVRGDRLRLRLNAPPVDGRANAALIEFIAAQFDVPRARVVLEQGLASRDKRVRVCGVTALPPSLQAVTSQ